MDTNKQLKYLIKKHDFLIKDVAAYLGMSYSNFNGKLRRGTINYADVEKALYYLGYKIKWIKKQ